MTVEVESSLSERHLAELILRLRRLNVSQKIILKGLANGLKERDIAMGLGMDSDDFFGQKELISREMGERRLTDGVCKAIALSVKSGLISPDNIPNLSSISFNDKEMRFWAYMGEGLSSYWIAGKTGLRLELVDNRRRQIARRVGVKTIYRATALAAYAMRQAGGVEQSG